MRVGYSDILPIGLAALFGGLSKRCDSCDGPSTISPPHGSISANPAIDKMAKVGDVSITTIKYQLRKANIVANTLSKSQRAKTEDLNLVKAMMVGYQVFALRRVSIELGQEDLQKWTKAYQED